MAFSKRKSANPKRRIRACPDTEDGIRALEVLANRTHYGGNPEHKRNPGDFGLTPPARPRPDKTLCDPTGIFTRKEATTLLRNGIIRGLISEQARNGWPQNVWAVTENGIAVEAELENQDNGTYHGFPMLDGDPLADEVQSRWRGR